jgi:hypothetical protein
MPNICSRTEVRPHPEMPTVFPSPILDSQNEIIPELFHVRQPSPMILGLVPPLTLTVRRVHLMLSLIIFLRTFHSTLPYRSAHDNPKIGQ